MGLLPVALLIADLIVPASVTLVRYGAGILLLLEQSAGVESVRVISPEGKTLRMIEPRDALHRAALYDVTIVDPQTVALSVGTPGTLGPAVHRIAIFGSKAQPTFIETGNVICQQIAPDNRGGFWCLGPVFGPMSRGDDYDLLHHFDSRGVRDSSFLPRREFPRTDPLGQPAREPFQVAAVGPPQLLPTSSTLLAWIPAANLFATIDPATRAVERKVMSFPLTGRSTVSFAASTSGIRYALLPSTQPETFLTPYTLNRLTPGQAFWSPVPGIPRLPRSSYLLGATDVAVIVWLRTDHRIRWLPIP